MRREECDRGRMASGVETIEEVLRAKRLHIRQCEKSEVPALAASGSEYECRGVAAYEKSGFQIRLKHSSTIFMIKNSACQKSLR